MKKEKLPGFVVVAALTTITTIFWVLVSVYFKFKKEEAPVIPDEVIKDINPTLDETTLGKISNSFYIEDSQIPETIVTATISPSQTPKPTINPSPSASPSGTSLASPTPTALP